MTEVPIAPEGGVPNTLIAPAPAPNGVSTEVPAVQKDGDTFNAGYSKASEKSQAKLDEANAKIAELQKQAQEAVNKGMNPDELRKATEAAQEKVNAANAKVKAQHDYIMGYLDTRKKALPEGFQAILDATPTDNIEAYTKALEGCEKEAGTPGPKPPSQGQPITPGVTNVPLDKYDAALKAGDGTAIKKIEDEFGKQPIHDALIQRHATMKG